MSVPPCDGLARALCKRPARFSQFLDVWWPARAKRGQVHSPPAYRTQSGARGHVFRLRRIPESSFARNPLGDPKSAAQPCCRPRMKSGGWRPYRRVRWGIGGNDLADIRAYVQQQRALGSPRFQAQIAEQLARKVEVLPHGRPRKPLDSDARAAEVTLPI